MKKSLRILASWSASDFQEFFEPAFRHSGHKIEIISGNRSKTVSPYAVNQQRLARLKKQVREKEFDLILCGNIWNTPWPGNKGIATSLANAARFYTYKRGMLDTYWISQLAKSAEEKTPIAGIDLRDSSFILPRDLPLFRVADLYFKRELFFMPSRSLFVLQTYHGREKAEAMAGKLRPLSYGVTPAFLNQASPKMQDRPIDLFISGGDNAIRLELKRRSRAFSSKWRVEIVEGFLSQADYIKKLQSAKLVLCTESFGCETWRQYEAAACGAVPLLNWPFTQNYLPFEPDRHAIYFSLIGQDFENQVARSLQDPESLQKISIATRDFVHENKDRKKIGDYIIKTTLEHFAEKKKK